MKTTPRRDSYDVVVIGAGPAGLAAAATAAEAGLSMLLLDENAGPGGQVWRAIDSTPVMERDRAAPRLSSARRSGAWTDISRSVCRSAACRPSSRRVA